MVKQGLGRLLAGVLALGLFVALGGGWAAAQGRQPELMEGKKTLFKRVIVRPGATLFPAAADQGGAPMPAFSVLYVYGKSGDFVEVGKTIGAVDGFVKGDRLIEWKQTIVAVFNSNRANRERSLLFKSPEAIDAVIQNANPREKLAQLRAEAAAGRPGDGSVLAIEPETPPDIRQNLLFPILSVTKRLPQVDGRIRRSHRCRRSTSRRHHRPTASAAWRHAGGRGVRHRHHSDHGPYIDKVREAMTRVWRGRRHGRRPEHAVWPDRLPEPGRQQPGHRISRQDFLKLGKEHRGGVREGHRHRQGIAGAGPRAGEDCWAASTRRFDRRLKDFDAKFVVGDRCRPAAREGQTRARGWDLSRSSAGEEEASPSRPCIC